MKILNFDFGPGEVVSFQATQAILTIRDTLSFEMELIDADADTFVKVLNNSLFGDHEVTGHNDILGDHKDLGSVNCSFIVDEDAKTYSMSFGDTEEGPQDVKLEIIYECVDKQGGTVAGRFVTQSLVKFWSRAKNKLLAQQRSASGMEAGALGLVIAVLRFSNGEGADIGAAVQDWVDASGRRCDVSLVNSLSLAA